MHSTNVKIVVMGVHCKWYGLGNAQSWLWSIYKGVSRLHGYLLRLQCRYLVWLLLHVDSTYLGCRYMQWLLLTVQTVCLVSWGWLQLKCDGTWWRTGGEVKEKLANVVGSLHTSLEYGVSSITTITTAGAHTSAASSRLNWRPCRFKWTRPFRLKTKSGFCMCAITFQLASMHLQCPAWSSL